MSKPHLIRLLVSVRSSHEVLAALEGGADIIDVKDPSHGPMGMADPRTIEAVLAAVHGRKPVSVALGELVDDPPLENLPLGVVYAKLGLAKAPPLWRKQLARKFAQVPRIRPIAVAYGDFERAHSPPPHDVIRWAIEHQAAGILFDTAIKDGTNLFRTHQHGWRQIHEPVIRQYVQQARAGGLVVALAGSLTGEALACALELNPDIIAVRSAACAQSDRNDRVEEARVRQLADLIAAHNAQAVSSAG